MSRCFAFAVAALSLASPAFAQDAPAPEAVPDARLETLHARPPGVPAKEAPAVLDAAFDPATKVEGQVLQVVFGERAVFTLGADGAPVFVAAEKGQLAVAHPEGTATETFAKPQEGQLAVALDGSAEKQATYLRVWNSLDYPVAYKVILVTLRGGKLVAMPGKACAAPAKGARYEIWPQPVVAVALSKFSRAASATACN